MPEYGLSYDHKPFVVARDPEAGKILLGGLGALQVGQMWFTEDPCHKDYPGYDEAASISHEEARNG